MVFDHEQDKCYIQAEHSSSLHYRQVSLAGTILWDASTDWPRPEVPSNYRHLVLDTLHWQLHSGIAGSLLVVAAQYDWPPVNKHFRMRAQQCSQCSWDKTRRDVASPLDTFGLHVTCFPHAQTDVVGSWTTSQGYPYLLVYIDRFTGWSNAIPISTVTADTL